MTDCLRYEDLCSLAVDGQLTGEQETELMEHIEQCPACADYLEALKAIKNGFDEMDLPVPDTLHRAIMTEICRDAEKRTVQYRQPKHRIPVFSLVATAAAAVILVLSGRLIDLSNLNRSLNSVPAQDEQYAASTKADQAAPDQTTKESSDSSNSGEVSDGTASAKTSEPKKAASSDSSDKTVVSKPKSATGADSDHTVTSKPAVPAAGGGGGGVQSNAAPKASAAAPSAADGQSSSEPRSFAAPSLQENMMVSESAGEGNITIPPSVSGGSYAFCVVARGTGSMPEIQGTLIAGEIGGAQAFFTVKNNLTLLEELLDSLMSAGYEPTIDKSGLVVLDKNADTGLVILMKDS